MSLIISKAISQLLLPPGGLILLALLGLIFWKRLWGRGLVVLSLLCFWLLATEPVRDQLLSPLENKYPALQVDRLPADLISEGKLAIVLLGGGVYGKAPEYGGRDMLTGHAMLRTVYAADLALDTGLNVYSTGGAIYPELTEPEGLIMQRWLVRLGVPRERTHAETAAKNTWENAANIAMLLKEKGIKQIVLVTTAWHMPRSVRVFESHGLQVIAAPCAYVVERGPYDLRSYLPHWGVLSASGDALHEYLGLLWYRLRYGESFTPDI
jgi:uncharacterized SAM-binding protein YcdF (DUF218 family)